MMLAVGCCAVILSGSHFRIVYNNLQRLDRLKELPFRVSSERDFFQTAYAMILHCGSFSHARAIDDETFFRVDYVLYDTH